MIPMFDAHCDTIFQCYSRGGGFREAPERHLDLLRLKSLGPCAQFFACFGEPEDLPGRPPWQVFQEESDLFLREMASNADLAVHCRTAAEAREAWAAEKTACFLSVEGAELLDCDPEKLALAYEKGVRAVNITWNHANVLSGTNLEETDRGLSPRGRAFVREMDRLGMIVDVSHLSDPGFWDVVEETKGPFMASHSNSRDLFFHTRNLTDEQFTAIIKKRGVAGLNAYAGFLGEDPDLDTLIAHLEHFLALGGEHSVALGGDWDGCSPLPRGIRGIQDMDKLYEALLRRNYSETLVRDLFCQNLMRVVSEVCSM